MRPRQLIIILNAALKKICLRRALTAATMAAANRVKTAAPQMIAAAMAVQTILVSVVCVFVLYTVRVIPPFMFSCIAHVDDYDDLPALVSSDEEDESGDEAATDKASCILFLIVHMHSTHALSHYVCVWFPQRRSHPKLASLLASDEIARKHTARQTVPVALMKKLVIETVS